MLQLLGSLHCPLLWSTAPDLWFKINTLDQKLEMALCFLYPEFIVLHQVAPLGRICTQHFSQVPHKFCWTWMKAQSPPLCSTTSWVSWIMPTESTPWSLTTLQDRNYGCPCQPTIDDRVLLDPCFVALFPISKTINHAAVWLWILQLSIYPISCPQCKSKLSGGAPCCPPPPLNWFCPSSLTCIACATILIKVIQCTMSKLNFFQHTDKVPAGLFSCWVYVELQNFKSALPVCFHVVITTFRINTKYIMSLEWWNSVSQETKARPRLSNLRWPPNVFSC